MARHHEVEDADDRMLRDLFGTMDDITASDELKQATIDRIFAQVDDSPEEDPVQSAHLTLVYDGDALPAQGANVQAAAADGGESAPVGRGRAPRRRGNGWRWKVAAAIVAVAIVVSGGIAYAVPADHVLVSVDDTTFDLGVNVFGVAVSVQANTDEGKAAVSSSDAHNKAFRDALDRLLKTFGQSHEAVEDSVSVTVEHRFGGGDEGLRRDANQVLEQRRERPQEEQPQTLEPEAPAPDGGEALPQPAEPDERPNGEGDQGPMGEDPYSGHGDDGRPSDEGEGGFEGSHEDGGLNPAEREPQLQVQEEPMPERHDDGGLGMGHLEKEGN